MRNDAVLHILCFPDCGRFEFAGIVRIGYLCFNQVLLITTMNVRRFTLLAFVSFLFFACAGTEREIEVESIAISQPGAEMEIGESLSLKAEVFPSNATYDGMTWTSTKPKVASVSGSGLVSALSEGTTTVTVMAGGKTASCSVTVVKGFVAVISINLDKASLEMVEGDTETLTASILPDDATDKTVTWTSSEKGVATVKGGLVSAISPGTATITAKAGDVTAICNIVVQKKNISVESVELDKTELSLFVDESATLTATVKPGDATDQSVSWKSSNEKVAKVSSSGEIQAIGVGKATITVTTMDGGKTASCSVEVKNRVESITITAPYGEKEISVGSTLQLKVTVTPEGLSDTETEWKSSNTSVATVSTDGLVTAKSKGTVTITVTVKNGSETKTANYEITVIKPVTKVSVSPTTLEMYVGDVIDMDKAFSVTVEPDDAEYAGFKYSISTAGIISVSEGKIEGVKAGSVTLYITPNSSNPKNLKAEVKITVKAKPESITIQGTETKTVQVKKTIQLKASIAPSNASQEVVWSSSKPAIATVDENGLVTGIKAGTTVITATSKENPSIKAICTVNVENVNIPVSSVELDRSSLSLTKGDVFTLNATVKPDDATDKTVSWKSSNTAVATVDSNGKVKAIAGGSATITATAGGVSAKCSVTVSVPVTSVSLNKTSLNLMVGDTETLSATIYPSDATNKNVTWKSSNTSVATVQSGKVSAVGVGTAQITVTTNNGSKKATCTVTVTPKGDPGPKGYKVFIKHGGEFKYDDIPEWGTYQGKAFTSPNTKYNYSGDNHELNVTTSSTEVKNMLNELGMSINQLYENYGMDSPEIFVKKNTSGYYVEPGDIADEGSNTNLYRVYVSDINSIYGSGLIINKVSPSNWNELLLELDLTLDPEVSIGGPHFVYVVYPALDNTKNVDVVVKFVYNVTM